MGFPIIPPTRHHIFKIYTLEFVYVYIDEREKKSAFGSKIYMNAFYYTEKKTSPQLANEISINKTILLFDCVVIQDGVAGAITDRSLHSENVPRFIILLCSYI